MIYNLKADIKTSQQISAELGISFSDGGGGSSSPPYTGEYEVTPKSTAQTLNTQGFLMLDNVSVLGIPISITENQAKGNTVFIG